LPFQGKEVQAPEKWLTMSEAMRQEQEQGKAQVTKLRETHLSQERVEEQPQAYTQQIQRHLERSV
jgi:hypothetical protein